jgi:ribosomal protein S4E
MTRARETARAGFMTEKTFPTGKNVVFRLNDQNIVENITIDSDNNAMAAGPISIDSGITLTLNGNMSIV